jgi:AbiU2
MPSTKTPSEVRDDYVEAMPGPLGEAYYELFNHVANLFEKWHTYRVLFDEHETIDLLNKTAGGFFRSIQLTLRENIFMHLCRLTDPPRSAGKENLSLRAVPKLLPATVDPGFRDALQIAIDDSVAKMEFARVWRNKILAHTPLPVTAGGVPFVIPAVRKADWIAAMEAIGSTMNLIEHHYLNTTVGWDSIIDDAAGTLGLLHYLQKGLDAQELEEAVWRDRHKQ